LFLFTGPLQTGLGSVPEQMYQLMWFLPGKMMNARWGFKKNFVRRMELQWKLLNVIIY
jgi:hypothetical protein